MQNLRPVAAEAGLTLSQLAVAWTLQNPNVSAAIVGATRPEQVHENVKAAGVKLDSQVMAKIDEIIGAEVISGPGGDEEPAHAPLGRPRLLVGWMQAHRAVLTSCCPRAG